MKQFILPEYIKNLETTNIESNLAYYKYDTRKLRKQLKSNIDKTLPEFISTYSSFKGEVYENVLYELLLKYASDERDITQFILKGPHQNKNAVFNKQGLMIDKSAQIVYKSAYKDISEFDALFFTEDSIYFVEMSTSKKTASLNKRLNKKSALLKVLFPKLHIKALIILTKGSTGLKRFPEYCTIWITKEMEDETLLFKILENNIKKEKLKTLTYKKFVETDVIKYGRFQYFQTLEWILKKSRSYKNFVVDLRFFTSQTLSLYFDIFSKLYIGHMSVENFKTLAPKYENDIKKVIVTIEKINTTVFDVVYYVRESKGKLKRVYIKGDEVNIKEKEIDGFTNSETKFIVYVLEDEHILNLRDIDHLRNNIPNFL